MNRAVPFARRRSVLLVAAVGAAVAVGACSGGDDIAAPSGSAPVVNETRCLDTTEAETPHVEWVFDAIAAVEAYYRADQRFFEVSADRRRVSVIVAAPDGHAEQSFYCGDAGFGLPEPLGPADGATFAADDVALDPDLILSGLRAELPDSEIVDVAVQGASGSVIYDATVRSAAGGTLLVLLSATGDVLAVQTT